MNGSKSIIFDSFNIISGLKSELIQFMPNFLTGMAILIGGIFIAFVVKWFSQSMVNWILLIIPSNFKRKTLVRENLTSISTGTGRIIFTLVIVLSLTSSMDTMGFTIISNWLQNIIKFAPNIIGALFILFLGWNIRNILCEFISKSMNKLGIGHARLISEALSWIIFGISLFVSLDQIGIDLGYFLIFMGLVFVIPLSGVALAFAYGAKDSIRDIIACHHLKYILSVKDLVHYENKDRIIRSIGPVFITMENEGELISVSGSKIMTTHFIHRKV